MAVAGIDVGSRSIELIVLEGEDVVLSHRRDATFDPLAQCRLLLEGLAYARLVATGYGRRLVASHFPAKAITEIQAYALGSRRLFPSSRTILDIGGQDTKA